MVDLMLNAGCPKPVEMRLVGLAIEAKPANIHLGGALHIGVLIWDREAALFVDIAIL